MPFGAGSRWLFSVVLLVFCFSVSACGQTEKEKVKLHNEYAEKASEFRKKGKLKQAIEEQKKAVEMLPKDGNPLMVLANLYLELYEENKSREYLEEAKRNLETATKLYPNDPIGHEMLSETLKRLGDNEGALKEIKIVIELQPDDLDNLVNLGAIYSSLGNYKLAEESFEKALKINPNFVYALYQYGEFEYKKGNMEKASTLFTRVVGLKKVAPSEDAEFIKESEIKLEELKNQKAKAVPN